MTMRQLIGLMIRQNILADAGAYSRQVAQSTTLMFKVVTDEIRALDPTKPCIFLESVPMAIVRQDKRQNAIAAVNELRASIDGAFRTLDAMQARLEALELDLGLANEGEQADREQLRVLHYAKGDQSGHALEDCTEKCVGDAEVGQMIEALAGSDSKGESDEGES